MMYRFLLFVFISCGTVLGLNIPAKAQTYTLATDVSTNSIEITTGFSGARVAVFGTKTGGNDVIVVLRGPKGNTTVRESGQFAGVWMNVAARTFRDVPRYYDIAASGRLSELLDRDTLVTQEIGVNAMQFDPVGKSWNPGEDGPFLEALIREKQIMGLFPQTPQPIHWIDTNFFKADFVIPDDVPNGRYRVDVYLVDKGRIQARQQLDIDVLQTGLAAWVQRIAYQHSVAYALFALCIAMLGGFSGYVLLRKD